MATSSILGGTQAPGETSGKDLRALGPSDNTDSGSDAIGAYGDDELSSDSDAAGTGERATVGRGREHPDADILPDQVQPAPNGPGIGPDPDLDDESGDDFNDLSEVDDLVDDDLDDLDEIERTEGIEGTGSDDDEDGRIDAVR